MRPDERGVLERVGRYLELAEPEAAAFFAVLRECECPSDAAPAARCRARQEVDATPLGLAPGTAFDNWATAVSWFLDGADLPDVRELLVCALVWRIHARDGIALGPLARLRAEQTLSTILVATAPTP